MKLNIGDIVKVINVDYYHGAFDGCIGKVVCFHKFLDGTECVGVDFCIKNKYTHDLDRHLENNTGRYFSERVLYNVEKNKEVI